MAKLWRLMGEYTAETTTYTACAAGAKNSPYRSDFDGKLVALRVMINRSAATSLINGVQFKLSSTTFRPNSIECGAVGGGLATAPAFQPAPVDWIVNQTIKSSIDVTVEGRNITADTPITVSALVWGLFEVA